MDKTSERLKEMRLSHNLTLEQVAEVVGMNRSSVQRWETGKTDRISRSTIALLAKHYNVNPLWLCGLSDEKSVAVQIDALEEDILRMFRELNNPQKITMYNSVKILYEGLKNT